MQHVRSAARGRIHDISKVNHALFDRTGVLQQKEQWDSVKRHRTVYKIRPLWMNMDVKVTAVQWCPQQLKEFFADEIPRPKYQWDACCMSHNNPEQVALGKASYQDGVTFCGTFKVPRKFLYCFSGNTGGHTRWHCTAPCRKQWLGGLKLLLFKVHLKQRWMSTFCVGVAHCI
jgi:hypothetical protein